MASYVVSGAGTSACNGTYDEHEVYNEVMGYKLIGENMYLFRFYGEVWVIGPTFGEDEPADGLYFTINAIATPPSDGWNTLEGEDPAPTVAEAPAGTNTQINIGDSWKEVSEMKINIGDSWKEVAGLQINIGDSWKEVF